MGGKWLQEWSASILCLLRFEINMYAQYINGRVSRNSYRLNQLSPAWLALQQNFDAEKWSKCTFGYNWHGDCFPTFVTITNKVTFYINDRFYTAPIPTGILIYPSILTNLPVMNGSFQ